MPQTKMRDALGRVAAMTGIANSQKYRRVDMADRVPAQPMSMLEVIEHRETELRSELDNVVEARKALQEHPEIEVIIQQLQKIRGY